MSGGTLPPRTVVCVPQAQKARHHLAAAPDLDAEDGLPARRPDAVPVNDMSEAVGAFVVTVKRPVLSLTQACTGDT